MGHESIDAEEFTENILFKHLAFAFHLKSKENNTLKSMYSVCQFIYIYICLPVHFLYNVKTNQKKNDSLLSSTMIYICIYIFYFLFWVCVCDVTTHTEDDELIRVWGSAEHLDS